MPTYDYQCRSCGHTIEVIHSMSEDGPTTCEVCGGQLRRVLYPAGIIFKGSGFYKTDSRSGASSSSSPAGRNGSGSPGDGTGSVSTGAADTGAAPASGSPKQTTRDSGAKPAPSTGSGEAKTG